MMKEPLKKVTVVSIRKPKEFSHRSRRKRKIRSEESLNQQQKMESSKILSGFDGFPSTKSNILPDIDLQIQKENSSPTEEQLSTEKKIDLGTIDDILIETKKTKKKNSSFFSTKPSIPFLLVVIVLLILLVCAIVIPTMLILYPMTTTTASSLSMINTTTLSSTTTTSMTTRTTTTQTSTSTSTVATISITSNICTSSWSGITLIYSCQNCTYYPMYYLYSYNYTAIATTTRIAFAFRGRNGYFSLDDVSVRDLTTSNTEILINGGFEMSNLTGWSICDQYNSSTMSGVKNNLTNISYFGLRYYSRTGSYYYLGGTSNLTDYISQTFSTIVGNLYLVTFAGMSGVNGSMASADFFLGI